MKKSTYIIVLIVILMVLSSVLPQSVQAKLLESHRVLEYGKPVPILFIHGYNDKGTSWEKSSFYRWAKLQGIPVVSVDYNEYSRNDFTTDQIQDIVKEAIEKLPDDQPFDIVAHSMGGLVTRWLLKENPSYEQRIRKVIMIGTPNHGSPWATKNRISSMIDEPEEYMNDDQLAEVEDYKKDYKKYSEDYFENFTMEKKQKMSFETWLFEERPTLKKSLKNESVATTVMKNHQEVSGGFKGRYTKAFLTYVMIATGRFQAKEEYLNSIQHGNPLPGSEKVVLVDGSYLPETSSLDEMTAVKEFNFYFDKNSAKNIVQDRLALERITLTTGIDKEGKLIRDEIAANPVLHEMAEYEYEHRSRQVKSKEYVPQYVTIATSSSDGADKDIMTNYVKYEPYWRFEDHDLVVPVSSVKLDYSESDGIEKLKNHYLDRNVVVTDQEVKHTEQMEAEEILVQEYTQPLTGAEDANTYYELSPKEKQTFKLVKMRQDGRYVGVIQSTKDSKGEEFTLTFKGKGKASFYLVKRNEYQTWGEIEKHNLEEADSGFETKVNLKLKGNEDLLIFTDKELTITSSPLKKWTKENEVPYYLEIIDTTYENSTVVQTIRVIDRKTSQSINNLSKRDFSLTLNGKHLDSFQLSKKQSKVKLGENILMSLDHSGSMRESNGYYQSLRQTERYIEFLGKNKKKENLSVIGFADTVESLVPFTNNLAAAYMNLYNHKLDGGTAMYDSVVSGSRALSLEEGARRLILLSDGQDNKSDATIEEAISVANEYDVSVYPVGLGHDIAYADLERLANETGGQVYTAESADELNQMYTTITRELNTTYTVEFPMAALEKKKNKFTIEVTGRRSNQDEKELRKPVREFIETITKFFEKIRW